ncbi:MAG: Gfo/Idh/MocA family oxidoreductase [Pirellulaceae bacterium]
MVSTPDHARVSLAAMQLGKHVFCQKPLTHTVYEARQMQVAARVRSHYADVQSNPITAYLPRRWQDVVHAGLLGKVKKYSRGEQERPLGQRNLPRPTGKRCGAAQVRLGSVAGRCPAAGLQGLLYHPFNWRGWQACGLLGNWAISAATFWIPVFKSLKLTAFQQADG